MTLIIHYLALLGLLGSTAWLAAAPGWEPLVVALGTLAFFLGTEISALRAGKQDKNPVPIIETFADISRAFAEITVRMSEGKLKITKAELIQHSSQRAYNFIVNIAKTGADIDLFLQDPATAQQLSPPDFVYGINQRINGYREPLKRIDYKREFNLYLYSSPASLNGVRLETDDGKRFLILGWYAYYYEGETSSLIQYKVGGGENPCIIVNSLHEKFSQFNDFFEDLVKVYKSQSSKPNIKILNGSVVP